MSKPRTASRHPDAELIEALGGASKVAELLGLNKRVGGAQRVHNWMTRGIPPGVKLEHPDVFLRHMAPAANDAPAGPNSQAAAG